MSDEIESALTPEEWGYRSKERSDAVQEISVEIDGGQFCLREWNGNDLLGTTHTAIVKLPPEMLPAAMALANAALADGDPRKITYRDVDLLRETANSLESGGPNLWALATKLESLLPPDVTTDTMTFE